MSPSLAKCLATFFYIGYFPKAPGSLATVVGLAIALALTNQMIWYLIVLVVVTILGFLSSGAAEKSIGTKDPSCIVIDEVSGVMIAFFMLPVDWSVLWTGFFLFRAFDMFKIYPVNKFEDLPGGYGIMMDDLFAGLYTNIVMQIAIRLAGV